ncbi:MAG: hypothetical protein KGD59_06930 [Candidatus Heimdallarchaeota archaeon]|nr:hypothetical protein [Candidatus Heimdallarchaeota archaeon]MBY8994266.1 hypothetical protein [Candidatus Heimdallarchaeota archaeon]
MISLSKMKTWFENETENRVMKVRSEIKKRMEYIIENFKELKVAAQDFEVSDTVDSETRSSQNIFEKMTEMVEEFEFPNTITYKTAEEFSKELEKFLKRVLTLGQRFIPNLKKKYKTRVFILNRALTRVQKNYQDFEAFLKDKTVLLKEVDSASESITLLVEKVEEREKLKEEIKSESSQLTKLEKQITDLNDNTSDLETATILKELAEISKEMNIIVKKIQLQMGGLDKPFRKLHSRVQDGKVLVPPHLMEFVEQYKDRPLEAFKDMPEGHKNLNDLLELLKEAAEKEKIKLKPAMKNKTISLSQEIIDGSIKELHSELLQQSKKRKDIETRVEESGLKEQIMGFKEKQENLEKNKGIQQRRVNNLKERLENLNEDIASFAANIQRKIRRLTNQDVKINITE